jgi:hypothetical protein
MKSTIHANSDKNMLHPNLNLSFDKDFFTKSKYLLFAMSIASLYCVGYAIVLFHEFKKMGVLEVVKEML